MAGLNNKTKLLLHLNGVDAATATTDSSSKGHTITFHNNAELDTAAKKFNTASLLLDGTGDWISAANDNDSWDVFLATTTDWTIDMFVKHDDHAGNEDYVAQDNESEWLWRHTHGTGMVVYVDNNALVSAGEIEDTNWHHVALVKIGGSPNYTLGAYIDGVQVGHATASHIKNSASRFEIGGEQASGTNALDGHMDELRVQNSNIFGANPDAGLNDTIAVPTREYGTSFPGGVVIGSNPSIY